MAVRMRMSRRAWWVRLLLHPAGRFALGAAVTLALAGLVAFTYYYVRFSRLIDQKLRAGPFQATSMIFAAPRAISVGDEVSAAEIVRQLESSGYSESRNNRTGYYHLRPGAIEIFPGPDSYFDREAGVIKFSGGRVSQIISLRDNTERLQYLLEPELVTNLFDRNREKRRLVKYADIPQVLVDAVISAEDKRFFQHAGFDPIRMIKTAWVDVTTGRRWGASTLSQQLARMFWLTPEKTIRRKLAEALITLHLEQKLSKQELFEFYANQVPLGRRGSFAIHGFGEAARAYFGKDIRSLTAPEAALLAGLIQQPSFRNPFRHPDRARERRNVVLELMHENGYLTDAQYNVATAAPLRLAPAEIESSEAPYFVDLVNDELQRQFQDYDFQNENFRIYTTLDLDLQRAAAEAVRIGMQEADARLRRQRRFRNQPMPVAQCALIALDPDTGAVKALVGGRNYGLTQLNRVLAKRQPGSSFKPFVYATALETALKSAGGQAITPATMLLDEPTTFWFNDKPYAPDNFEHKFYGEVSLRQALAKSLNVPTVKLAQMVGYQNIEELAQQSGMNLAIQATPAIALGAYEVTPLEIAGAYTIYVDQGTYVKPNWISLIRDRQGRVIYTQKPVRRDVLDPRVAYLMTNLMEEVLRSGTGAGVRARGFTLPAAGKTGTSHDGWFAGFTSRLICVVWVGFDDNRELNLEGAHSALPIWTEFMKRAHTFREYRNVSEFRPPEGIVSAEIDPLSGQLATPACPTTRTEYFLSGTQPIQSCHLHGAGAGTRVASWEAPPPAPAPQVAPPVLDHAQPRTSLAGIQPVTPPPAQPPPAEPQKEKKKGLLRRIWGVFK